MYVSTCVYESYFSIAARHHHDQGNIQKKEFTRNLLIVSESAFMTIMVGITGAGRQAWC